MNLQEKTLSQEYIFNGKVVTLRVDEIELPNKKKATREVIEHPGAVAVIPFTENNEIYLVKQFRYPYGEVIIEIPAGKLEKNEIPLEAAKRELKEETGCIARDYFDMGKIYVAAGYSDEIIYLYGCSVESIGEMQPDDDEFLQVVKMPLKDALTLVLDNQIKDSKTQIAILRLAMQKGVTI